MQSSFFSVPFLVADWKESVPMGCFPWFPRKSYCARLSVPFGKVGEDDANAKKYKGSQDVQGKSEGPGGE